MQEKSPIPATTPAAAQDSDSDQSQTTRGKSKHKNVYSKQWENEYPWVYPVENFTGLMCKLYN